MDITIQQLIYFAAICKYMNYTRASQKLFITQPALSSSVSRLEKELGVPLFKRKGRNIELTEDGAIVLSHVTTILDTFNSMKNELEEKRSADLASPVIYFGRNSSRSITPFLQEFIVRHPNVTLTEDFQSPLELQEALLNKSLDFIIISPALDDPRFFTRNILEEEILLQVPAQHELAKESEIRLADCANEKFMGFAVNYPFRTMIKEFFTAAGFKPDYKIQMETSSLLEFRTTASAGNYFGLFPKSLCRPPYDAEGKSVFRHIREPKCTRTIAFQWLRSNPPDKLTNELLKSIENYYNSDDFTGDII